MTNSQAPKCNERATSAMCTATAIMRTYVEYGIIKMKIINNEPNLIIEANYWNYCANQNVYNSYKVGLNFFATAPIGTRILW